MFVKTLEDGGADTDEVGPVLMLMREASQITLGEMFYLLNLKLKIRPDAEHQYNSPWNIAADFDLNMNFSAGQIRGMLEEYEADNRTGMDVSAMAEEIYQYTSGYPYLGSALCKIMDEKLPEELPEDGSLKDRKCVWSGEGLPDAVKILLNERSPL